MDDKEYRLRKTLARWNPLTYVVIAYAFVWRLAVVVTFLPLAVHQWLAWDRPIFGYVADLWSDLQ